jgi:hypothetical protein
MREQAVRGEREWAANVILLCRMGQTKNSPDEKKAEILPLYY